MPTFICGALILFFLPSGPGKCRFLNERENAVAYARVFQGKPGEQEKGLNLKRMSRGLIRPWTWLIAIIHFCGSTAFNSISVFLTAILRDVSPIGSGHRPRIHHQLILSLSTDGFHFDQGSGNVCTSLHRRIHRRRRHCLLVRPQENKGNLCCHIWIAR